METMWLATSSIWLIVLAIVLLVANLVLTFLILFRSRGIPTDQGVTPPPPPPDKEERQIADAKLEAAVSLLIRNKTFTNAEFNDEIKRIRGK